MQRAEPARRADRYHNLCYFICQLRIYPAVRSFEFFRTLGDLSRRTAGSAGNGGEQWFEGPIRRRPSSRAPAAAATDAEPIVKSSVQRNWRSYCAVMPPSMTSSEPVFHDASSDARNSTPLA